MPPRHAITAGDEEREIGPDEMTEGRSGKQLEEGNNDEGPQ